MSLSSETLTRFSASLADEAAVMSRAWFRKPLAIETKADLSPVTIADQTIEAFIRKRIEETFPDHGVLGEEHGAEKIDAEYLWIVDPIDGTRSFITGSPLYGMLLALLKEGEPVFGQIDMPVLGERWVGVKGAPTLFNGASAKTSDCAAIEKAAIYSTSPDCFEERNWAAFDRISKKCAVRRFGGDCYSYGLLASGFIDLIIEDTLHPYDYLALIPVIEGAGGVVTDWEGRALGLQSGGRLLAAANRGLHEKALEELSKGG